MFVIKMHLAPGKFIEVILLSFLLLKNMVTGDCFIFTLIFCDIECLRVLRLLSGKLVIVLQRDA